MFVLSVHICTNVDFTNNHLIAGLLALYIRTYINLLNLIKCERMLHSHDIKNCFYFQKLNVNKKTFLGPAPVTARSATKFLLTLHTDSMHFLLACACF